METSSNRPYLLIFSIVALVVAGFIIKAEYSSNNLTEDEVAAKSPKRMLVRMPGVMDKVPEPTKDWFKRVGYKDLGFESQQQMEAAQEVADVKGPFTPDQLKVIHKLLITPGVPHDLAVGLLPGLMPRSARAEFIPEIKQLYMTSKPALGIILSSWCKSGDEDIVKRIAKDADKDVAEYANQIIINYEYPSAKDQ